MSDLFKSLVWDLVVKEAMASLLATLPGWLGGGPLGAALLFIAMKIADRIYAGLKMTVELEVIYLKNEAHRKAYTEASIQLKQILKISGPDSQEFKDAREMHKKSLAEFVRFSSG